MHQAVASKPKREYSEINVAVTPLVIPAGSPPHSSGDTASMPLITLHVRMYVLSRWLANNEMRSKRDKGLSGLSGSVGSALSSVRPHWIILLTLVVARISNF